MILTGEMLLGAKTIRGSGPIIYAVDPATGTQLQPAYPGGTKTEVDKACKLAAAAFNHYRHTDLHNRARFLETIAEQILELGDALIERAMAETGLPRARLEGERMRTVNQLKLFANVVREGHWLDVRIDRAIPERQPPRSDIRMHYIPLGPVAVFGASNFPLAFSVAGGDTASALAAGAPVVVKAHPAHPGTSELVGRAIRVAVNLCGLPEGTFSLLYLNDNETAQALVRHPHIKAVGFTGSRAGGLALQQVAAQRAEPIPVYAEMSSINPVFLLPATLAEQAENIAENFVSSLTMGAGQFCTNPGLVIGVRSEALVHFIQTAGHHIQQLDNQTMLSCGIYESYLVHVNNLAQRPRVKLIAQGQQATQANQARPTLFSTSAKAFLADEAMSQEVFGACGLIVQCKDEAEMLYLAGHLEGQLTATIHGRHTHDKPLAKKLLTELELKAGRILFNGFPTGVEVCHAMVHGGPFPATTDSRTTSVGSAAIQRFLRPVCYQDVPPELLPDVLLDSNPLHIRQSIS